MLRNAVKRFGDDLSKVSENIKSKAANQIKNNIKKTKYEQAKIPLDQAASSTLNNFESSTSDHLVPPVENELEI